MEWGTNASKNNEWKGRDFNAYFLPYPHVGLEWFVCESVCLCLRKCWLTFEWVNQYGWDFQSLVDLVVATLWVGSTTAESPKDKTWPKSRPFPLCLSLLWLWCYQIVSFHLGKKLRSWAKGWQQIFDLGILWHLQVYEGGGSYGSHFFVTFYRTSEWGINLFSYNYL